MVKIIISGDTPLEALSTAAAFGMHCMGNKEVCDAGYRVLEAERYKEQKAAAEAAEKKAAEEKGGASPTAGNTTQPPATENHAPAQVPAESAATSSPAAPAPVPNSFPAPPVTQAPVTPPTPGTYASQAPTAPPVTAPTAPPVAAPTAAPSYNLNDIMTAGANFISAHPDKQEQLNALFPQFGITTLADLRPEQMGAFATAMRAVGVTI